MEVQPNIIDLNWSLKALARLGNLFRRRIIHISDGSATITIDDEQVHTARMQMLTRVCVENETSDYDRLRLGVLSSGLFQPHEEENNPNSDTLYWMSEEIMLGESENLRIELTGTTADDRISVYIIGYEARIIT